MHIPSGLSPRQASEQNYASSLFSRALKRVRRNAESLSQGEPRGALQIRAADETTSSGNNTVFIIIVRLSDVLCAITYFYLDADLPRRLELLHLPPSSLLSTTT